MGTLKNGDGAESVNAFRFSLTGLTVFCLCLVTASGALTWKMVGIQPEVLPGRALGIPDPDEQDKYTFTRQGPWGELFTQNISLERPVEYLNDEMKTVQAPVWTFRGMDVARVKALFVTNGLTTQEAEKALAPDRVTTRGTDTLFRPSEEFVFSLRPETRARLYAPMRGLDVNLCLDWPYYYPRNSIESVFNDPRLHPDDLVQFKRLVYGGKDAWRFTDFETLMARIPTPERRVAMTASLSRQIAVLARLCIRPDTDIDQVAAYWGQMPNVRFVDGRPMLEALKRLPKGGTVSLLYLLPPFARERLYTYPLPPAPGDPVVDCHWTTFNFSKVKPDNRFSSPAECLRYINEHFYKVSQPGVYGDVLLFMNDTDKIRHSAVFLADDLVFTKNGQNYTMPWMIMRIGDLQAMYSDCNVTYIRRKAGS
jgi:hypothetical protein